ncbi:MAG TPA: cell division protein FtsL [Burkholderiaceae bacterium]|nr:cell division protein FtsL [Burkholderiaceae bacterium]
MMSYRAWAAVLGLALFAGGLGLVNSQYRARSLFVDLEAAQQEARRLDADATRLNADLGTLTQPASVAVAAHNLGLRPIEPARTIYLGAAPAVPGAQGAP